MGIKHNFLKFVKIFKFLPVLIAVAVAAWSYYAYVIQLCLFSVQNPVQKVLYLAFYHLFFIMLSWSYLKVILTPVARVPKEFRPPAETDFALHRAESQQQRQDILEEFSRNLPVVTRSHKGVRFCKECNHIKPDRAHHCRVCECCVLKMDHHCLLVNTCIGWSNYKFFILFLGYVALYCLYVSLTSSPFFITFWRNQIEEGFGEFHTLFLIATILFFGVFSLFLYHIHLLLHNRSTLESLQPPVFGLGPDKNGFHLGKLKNVAEVFGDDMKFWFFPIFTSKGNGVSYHQKTFAEEKSNLLRQGQNASSDGIDLHGLSHFTQSHNPYTSVLIETV